MWNTYYIYNIIHINPADSDSSEFKPISGWKPESTTANWKPKPTHTHWTSTSTQPERHPETTKSVWKVTTRKPRRAPKSTTRWTPKTSAGIFILS